jgi:hypothetical protein
MVSIWKRTLRVGSDRVISALAMRLVVAAVAVAIVRCGDDWMDGWIWMDVLVVWVFFGAVVFFFVVDPAAIHVTVYFVR